jgi:hypothetical protein
MPGGTRLQQGNEILDQLLYNPSVTFPTLGANASATNTLTVPGALTGDLISWNMQNPPAHLVIDNIWVSANNTLTILWGTDGTGVTGATVALLFSICRGENTSLGLSALPSALI